MFSTRKFVAGVLALFNSVAVLLTLPVQAAGPSPIVLTLDNQTASSYSLVTCVAGQNIRPLYADYANLSAQRRSYLPAKTVVNGASQDAYYVHGESEVLTVHLVNFGFTLSGADTDCALPSAYAQDFVVSPSKTLDLVLSTDLALASDKEPGTLRVRNYLDSPFLVVLCDDHVEGQIRRSSTIRARGTQQYSLTEDSALYVVPGTLSVVGSGCGQLLGQASQVLYYNYRPGTTATRTIAGFVTTQPVPEVEIQSSTLATQEVVLATPGGRSLEVTTEAIRVTTPTLEAALETDTRTEVDAASAAPQPVLIRTGGHGTR